MSVQVTVALGDDGLVAVKAATTDDDIERLRAEAARIRHVGHPGVVTLVGLDDEPSGVRMRTRYAGDPLDTWSGSVAQAAGLASAVAATLADLHEAGIVHGRLDETHVLVGPDGRPRLCGLAGLPGAGPADDVLAVGRLVEWLLDRAQPDRRGPLPWQWGYSAHRRALAQVAGRVLDPVPGRRPSARGLAGSILAAVPDAELPPGTTPPTPPSPDGATDGPLWPEPPRPLPWTVVAPTAPPPATPSPPTRPSLADLLAPPDDAPTASYGEPLDGASGLHLTDAGAGATAPIGSDGEWADHGASSVDRDRDSRAGEARTAGPGTTAPAGRSDVRADHGAGTGIAPPFDPGHTGHPDSGVAPWLDRDRDRDGGADDARRPVASTADRGAIRPAHDAEAGGRALGRLNRGDARGRSLQDDGAHPAVPKARSGTDDDERSVWATVAGPPAAGGGPSNRPTDDDAAGADLAMRLARQPIATPDSWSPWSRWAAAAGLTVDVDAWRRQVLPTVEGPGAGRLGPAHGPRVPPERVQPRLVLVPGGQDAAPEDHPPDEPRARPGRTATGQARHPVVGLPAVDTLQREATATRTSRAPDADPPSVDDDSGTVRLEGWRDRRARQAQPEPPPRRVGRAAVAAAAGTLGVAFVAGVLLTVAPTDAPDGGDPEPAAGPVASDECSDVPPPAGDVDGDGCPDPLVVEGHTVASGDARWSLGQAGDVVAVGDWDCDGASSPAVLRPATGDVFVFPGWAPADAPLTVPALRTVPGAAALRPEPDADGCDALVVERRDGDATVVEEARA